MMKFIAGATIVVALGLLTSQDDLEWVLDEAAKRCDAADAEVVELALV